MITKAQCLNCPTELIRVGQKYCSRACRKLYENKHFIRKCVVCNRTPEETKFNKHPKTRDGLSTICSKCNVDRVAAKYTSMTGEERQAYNLKRRSSEVTQNTLLVKQFGITLENFKERLAYQNDLCAICRKAFSESLFPNVDHNHDTGAVRGILCRSCNLGLGSFYDSVKSLSSAIAYISIPDNIRIAEMLWAEGEKRIDFSPNRSLRISQQGKARLLKWQGDMCPICETPAAQVRNFHLDHDHEQGHIRGLLCETCNFGLGHFRDDSVLFESAVAYLRTYTDK